MGLLRIRTGTDYRTGRRVFLGGRVDGRMYFRVQYLLGRPLTYLIVSPAVLLTLNLKEAL